MGSRDGMLREAVQDITEAIVRTNRAYERVFAAGIEPPISIETATHALTECRHDVAHRADLLCLKGVHPVEIEPTTKPAAVAPVDF